MLGASQSELLFSSEVFFVLLFVNKLYTFNSAVNFSYLLKRPKYEIKYQNIRMVKLCRIILFQIFN